MAPLAASCAAFVGSHFLLSHPLRLPLVGRMGERAFLVLYSVVALVTFGAMVWAYRDLGDQGPLWLAGDALWVAGAVLMWIAAILLAGSFTRNPALPGARAAAGRPRGVLAITRHPMMWSFAIWALVHAILIATPKALLFDAAILILAIGGSLAQDRKKRVQLGRTWHDWSAQTAFLPFTRGLAWPGTVALAAGTLLFLLASWAHPMPVGVWRWLG